MMIFFETQLRTFAKVVVCLLVFLWKQGIYNHDIIIFVDDGGDILLKI